MTRGSLLIDTAPAGCWEDAFPWGTAGTARWCTDGPARSASSSRTTDLTWPDAPTHRTGPPDLAGRLPRVRELLLAGESAARARAVRRRLARLPSAAVPPRARDRGPPRTESSPDARPDGYRRTLSYRAGVAVTRWRGRRHACFVSRVRDLVVQQVTRRRAWDAVVDDGRQAARCPGRAAGWPGRSAAARRATRSSRPRCGTRAGMQGYWWSSHPGDGHRGPAHASSAASTRSGSPAAGDLTVLTRVEAVRPCRRNRRRPRPRPGRGLRRPGQRAAAAAGRARQGARRRLRRRRP